MPAFSTLTHCPLTCKKTRIGATTFWSLDLQRRHKEHPRTHDWGFISGGAPCQPPVSSQSELSAWQEKDTHPPLPHTSLQTWSWMRRQSECKIICAVGVSGWVGVGRGRHGIKIAGYDGLAMRLREPNGGWSSLFFSVSSAISCSHADTVRTQKTYEAH